MHQQAQNPQALDMRLGCPVSWSHFPSLGFRTRPAGQLGRQLRKRFANKVLGMATA